jgi:hypothetical protein
VARRGVFGRLPRAAPDLTNAIVALVRESQAQYDSNMVDAWKNGGEVDGEGVTDDRLLAHLKKRRDQLDPSDPAWDDWNNNYMQYDFAIEESKMSLKFDQGKISEKQMSSFYAKWAGREDVQKNSEFHRSLLSRAAKWQAAAKGRSAARGRSNKYEAHNNWVKGFYKREVQGAETATGYLVEIAKLYGAAPPNAKSLDDINPNSADYSKFLDVIEDGVAGGDPNVQGLINLMVSEIQKTNPGWTYSQSNLNELLDRGDRGLKRLEKESLNKQEADGWAGRRETMRYEKTRITQAAANKRIQLAADNYARDLDACEGNPYCARNVTKKFRDKLQGEVDDVVAGAGGSITMQTQDIKTASALTNTLRQLNTILAGGTVEAPAAAKAEGEPWTSNEYTIFDAAAGNDTAAGQLGTIGNGMNNEKDMLDNGGWVMTTPVTENGAQVYDGEGMPVFAYQVYAAAVPKPGGSVEVPGLTLMTDETRAATGPQGPTPITVTPTTVVNPSPPNVQYVDTETGVSITDKSAAENVRLVDANGAAVPPPWTELQGVKGPDGKTRTLYRTGDGTEAQPFLFHDKPPVAPGMTPNAAGQYTIGVVPTTDAKGNAFLKADVTEYIAARDASRQTLDSGNYVLGTFKTGGAAGASQAIGDLFANPAQSKPHIAADRYLADYARAYEQEPLYLHDPNDPQGIKRDAQGNPVPNPAREDGQRDYNQLRKVTDLYEAGKYGSMLDEYTAANADTPQVAGYRDQLVRAGFGQYGEDEMRRRVSLLSGIDAADARLTARQEAQGRQRASFRGRKSLFPGMPGLDREQEALDRAREDVFNPTVSVSGIKVPGLPPMVQNMVPGGVRGIATGIGGTPPGIIPAPVAAGPGAGGIAPAPKVAIPSSAGGGTYGPPGAQVGPTSITPVPTPKAIAPPTPTTTKLPTQIESEETFDPYVPPKPVVPAWEEAYDEQRGTHHL